MENILVVHFIVSYRYFSNRDLHEGSWMLQPKTEHQIISYIAGSSLQFKWSESQQVNSSVLAAEKTQAESIIYY